MITTNRGNSDDKKNRVQVGKLSQPDKELKNHEAESVKGGGGAMGGVDYRKVGEEIPTPTPNRPIGEEIPS